MVARIAVKVALEVVMAEMEAALGVGTVAEAVWEVEMVVVEVAVVAAGVPTGVRHRGDMVAASVPALHKSTAICKKMPYM
jgi:hypothetical protein